MAQETETEQDGLWRRIDPSLHAALDALGRAEREAVLLRFFDGLSLGEVGTALGLSEDAARMRVTRALEKMRRFLVKEGIAVSASVLAGLLTEKAAPAAPGPAVPWASQKATGAAGPAPHIQQLAQGATRMIGMTKTTVVAALVGIGLGGGLWGIGHGRRHAPPVVRPLVAAAADGRTQAEAVQATAASGWRATLPSGVKVELLGVSAPPASVDLSLAGGQTERWWGPDGAPLTAAPWEPAEFSPLSTYVPEQTVTRQFALRLTHTEGQSLKESVSAFDAPLKMSGTSLMHEKGAGAMIQVAFGAFPTTQAVCDLRYGLATGPWRTAASVGPRLGAAQDGAGGTARFAWDTPRPIDRDPKTGKQTPTLTVTDSLGPRARRVLAVFQDGSTVNLEDTFTDYPTPKATRMHALLRLQWSEVKTRVKEIRLETRAYEWVEFKDVHLQPRP